MTAAPTTTSVVEQDPTLRGGMIARAAQVAGFLLAQAVILFLGAGRLDWMWAWTYLAICLASVCVNAVLMLRTCPDLIAERGRPGQSTQDWDKVIAGIWALIAFLVLPIVAAFDVRWGWTGGVSTAWHVAGAVALGCGLALGSWAIVSNRYFSTAVRIQRDRGQTVCRTGPYRIVRHPGYVGFTLQTVATPVVLGSLWALLPAATVAVLMIVRTVLEDRLLHAELPGYVEYARDVRYRLLPGVW